MDRGLTLGALRLRGLGGGGFGLIVSETCRAPSLRPLVWVSEPRDWQLGVQDHAYDISFGVMVSSLNCRTTRAIALHSYRIF